jgi:hypothetical protein
MVTIVCVAALLAGCTKYFEWKDVSGQNRSRAQARADEDDCRLRAEESVQLEKIPTDKEVEIVFWRWKACMSERKWEMIHANQ